MIFHLFYLQTTQVDIFTYILKQLPNVILINKIFCATYWLDTPIEMMRYLENLQ